MGDFKNRIPVVLLLLLIAFTAILNVYWVRTDTAEMYRTEHPKFVTVRSYLESDFLYEECSFYPPVFFGMCAGTVSLFKTPLTYDHCVLVNVLYLVLALIGMFLLGRYLTLSDWYGLVSALLLLGVPAYLHISRRFIGEFGLTTCVIWAMYFLVSNDGWQDRGKSLFFGLVCGIGMLFKWSFPVYIIMPLLLSMGYDRRGLEQVDRKKMFHHILLSLLTALIVCGYWYAVRFDAAKFFDQFFENLYDADHISSSYLLFLKHNFLRSLQIIVLSGSFIFCLFVLTALAVNVKKLWRRVDYLMIVSWFVFPYIMFTCLGGDVLPRYLLPAFPALVLIVVCAFLSSNRGKNAVFLLILASFALGSIYYESFIHRPPQKYVSTKFDTVLQYIIDRNTIPRVVFNGINDDVTQGEVLDIYNLFYVHDIERRLGLNLTYVKTKNDLIKNINAPFILSQDISENNDVHAYLEKSGYNFSDRFSHYFHENTDPSDNWGSHGDYLLFEKRE
jgi:4-amino-4-deoxy-L-arabinose transferase-like glycosyltransferase